MGGVNAKHSAKENCRYIARLYGLDPDYVESFCRWVCGLGEYFDMPLATYSSGMRSRFSFSLLLSIEFDIYLIDEGMPATADVEFNRKAGNILQERLRNATVVIVSHPQDAGKILSLCRSAEERPALPVRDPRRSETPL
jgi:capsular polysaccharide transport system ATP-binding protein